MEKMEIFIKWLLFQCVALLLFLAGIWVGDFTAKEGCGVLIIAWAYAISISKLEESQRER